MHSPKNTLIVYAEDGMPHILTSRSRDISDLFNFMHLAITGKELFFKATTNPHRAVGRTISELGRHCKNLPEYEKSYDPTWTYSPLLSFFYEQYQQHSIRDFPCSVHENDQAGLTALAQVFDEFLYTMRQQAKESKLLAKTLNWNSKIKRNRSRLSDLVHHVCSNHQALKIAHVIFYSRDARLSEENILAAQREQLNQGNISQTLQENPENFRSMQRERTLFLSRMRDKPSIFDGLLNYVWRMEFTPYVGYQCSFIFFYGESKMNTSPHLGEQIGKYWEETTEGRGAYAFPREETFMKPQSDSLSTSSTGDSKFRKTLLDKIAPSQFLISQSARQKSPSPKSKMFGTGQIPQGI